jgi:hypothetical protein
MVGETSPLRDMIHHMDELNKSLQVPGENVLTSSYKILGFKRKLNLLKNHVVEGNLEMFPLLLGLESEKGHQQVSSLIVAPMKNCGTKLNIIFFPLQHKCMTG